MGVVTLVCADVYMYKNEKCNMKDLLNSALSRTYESTTLGLQAAVAVNWVAARELINLTRKTLLFTYIMATSTFKNLYTHILGCC